MKIAMDQKSWVTIFMSINWPNIETSADSKTKESTENATIYSKGENSLSWDGIEGPIKDDLHSVVGEIKFNIMSGK